MSAIEDVGLIKFDFLGLKTLTMIKLCCDLVEKLHGVKIDINNIHNTNPSDEKVFQNLREGDTCGIFQLETSSGIRDLLVKIIPSELEDIIALVAMYRPGPLGSPGMKMYLDARSGKSPPTYIAKELEPILKATAGWLIYQESAMEISRVIAGFTLAEADLLRRAMGKKKPEEMAKLEKKFIAGSISRGFPQATAVSLFNDIDKFSSYGFNKAHAACYGVISYQTAYLKTHYPVEFMCAALTCDYGNADKVIKYIAECKRLNIKVLPPDINQSQSGFTIATPTSQYSDGSIGSIRFGLSAIKNLGEEPVSYITTVRETGYKGILDFAQRVDLGKINRRKLESLVLAGAFDTSGKTRTSMLAAIDQIWDYKQEVKKCEAKTLTYYKKIDAFNTRQEEIAAAEKTGLKKPAALKKPLQPEMPSLPVIPTIQEMDDQELLVKEKELLGYYVSGHPLDAYSSALNTGEFTSIEELFETDILKRPIIPDGSKVQVPAIIASIQEKQTKKGDTMAFVTLEDKTGIIDVVLFAGIYAKKKEVLLSGKPLIIRGKVERSSDSKDGEENEEQAVSVPKIIAFDVDHIIKGEIRQEPIDIEIDPRRSPDLLKLLEKYPGDACQVNIFFRTSHHSLFKVNKIFSIGGNRGSFLRDLGRIVT
jgi:DNA polymerase-3 subunit alpha